MNAKNSYFGSSFLKRWGLTCVLCAPLAISAYGQQEGDSVEVTDYGTVTLAVQDTDLAQVLEMLSIQSQKNIITSKNVAATISANLYDVTFYEALDAILKVNGYDYLEEGNFIYVYTQSEMAEMEAARRRTESRIFNLNYLSASDAEELISPLLSEAGKSAARGDVEPGIKPDAGDVGQDNWAFTAMIVVNDYPENLDEVASLLGDLDVPPKQVLIEATILQTTLDEENAFGIDFSVLGNVDFTDLTAPLAGVGNLLNGDDASNGFQPADNKAFIGTSTAGQTAGPGTFKLGIVTNDIAAFLKVLDEVTDSVVLARPKIMCLNRQRAEVLVGRRVGYLSTTATETSTTQTVEFLDTGINLIFRPFISRNNMIRLEMSPSVSEAVLRDQTDASGVSVTIPDEFTNELTTNVRIQDGNTLVIGGLFRESTNITRRQVPVLGDIPIVGWAFRGQEDSVDREEIMFLITPSILHDDEAYTIGEQAEEYMEAVKVGARQGLLAFSLTKTSAAENNRAIEAFNAGDTEKALYHVNNSLRIHPYQPEMVRFRERILGVKEQPHEHSILERIFQSELGEFFDTDPVTSAWSPSEPVNNRFVEPAPEANVDSGQNWTEETAATNENAGFDVNGDETTGAFMDADFVDEEPVAGATWMDDQASDASLASDIEFIEAMEIEPHNDGLFESNPDGVEPAEIEAVVETTEVEYQDFDTFVDPNLETTNDFDGFEPVEIESDVVAEPALDDNVSDAANFDTFGTGNANNAGVPVTTTSDALPTEGGGGLAFNGANQTRFIDRFIHEYFLSLGLAEISSADAGAIEGNVEGASQLPFATFDEILEGELSDATTED